MLVSKNANFFIGPTRTLKFVLLPEPTPSTSQWNIGCVGSPMQHFWVGNVHFFLLLLISFAFGSQHKPSFKWNMGFKVYLRTVVVGAERMLLVSFIQADRHECIGNSCI